MRELGAAAVALALCAASGSALAQGDAKRGQYLAKAGGCVGCHTEEKQGAVPFAGGRALENPFGTFYVPNCTPHQNTGLTPRGEGALIQAIPPPPPPGGANLF